MAEKSAGTVAEIFAAFLKLGLTSFGGPIAHLGYFRAEFVERRKWLERKQLRRHRRALPVPAGSGLQPGRLHARHPARQRPARRAGGVVRLHHAVGDHSLRLRARRDGVHRPLRRRRAPRPEAGRGRRGGAGDLGHGQQPDAGSRAGRHRARPLSRSWFSSADRLARSAPSRLGPSPGSGCAAARARACGPPRLFGIARARRGRARAVRGAVPDHAAGGRANRLARACAVRRVLSFRRAGVRRRPCRAAAAAGGSGDAGLGQQRGFPRRLWHGAGGARTAVHLCGLSRRHRTRSQRAGGSG